MKQLILSALVLMPTLAFAQFQKQGQYDSYVLRMESERSVFVQVSTVFETKDACNHFGLSGEFRKVQLPEGSWSLTQEFVASFGIMGTEMACAPSKTSRTLPLVSQKFEIKPVNGVIYATILVPENMELSLSAK